MSPRCAGKDKRGKSDVLIHGTSVKTHCAYERLRVTKPIGLLETWSFLVMLFWCVIFRFMVIKKWVFVLFVFCLVFCIVITTRWPFRIRKKVVLINIFLSFNCKAFFTVATHHVHTVCTHSTTQQLQLSPTALHVYSTCCLSHKDALTNAVRNKGCPPVVVCSDDAVV